METCKRGDRGLAARLIIALVLLFPYIASARQQHAVERVDTADNETSLPALEPSWKPLPRQLPDPVAAYPSWTSEVSPPHFAFTPTKTVKSFKDSLAKRADDPHSAYVNCMIKGYCSLNQLKAGGFGQSSYTSLDQLKAPWQTSISPWPFPGLVSFLAAQGWSKDDFRIFNYKYPQPWRTMLPPEYVVWINSGAGVILANWVFAPRDPLFAPGTPTPTPAPLRYLSDYMFVTYKEACAGDTACLQRLEWVVHDGVSNAVVSKLVEYLGGLNLHLTPWPGYRMPWNTDPGAVFIGSPNGWGVVYMLGQHAAALSSKTIDVVYLFANDIGSKTLAFHITDLDADGEPDDVALKRLVNLTLEDSG